MFCPPRIRPKGLTLVKSVEFHSPARLPGVYTAIGGADIDKHRAKARAINIPPVMIEFHPGHGVWIMSEITEKSEGLEVFVPYGNIKDVHFPTASEADTFAKEYQAPAKAAV